MRNHIDLIGFTHVGRIDFLQRAGNLHTGVIMQNVQSAMFCRHRFKQCANGRFIGNIKLLGFGAKTRLQDKIDCFPRAFKIAIRYNDIGPIGSKDLCRGPANAGTGCGDEGNFALKKRLGHGIIP